MAEIVCYKCNQKGHKAPDCPNDKKVKFAGKVSTSETVSQSSTTDNNNQSQDIVTLMKSVASETKMTNEQVLLLAERLGAQLGKNKGE